MRLNVDYVTNPILHTYELAMPSSEELSPFVVGRQVPTPNGNRITQYSFKGHKISYSWDGMSKDELAQLMSAYNMIGYDAFTLTLTDGSTKKVVFDTTEPIKYTKRYNWVTGKIRYKVSLKLVEVP